MRALIFAVLTTLATQSWSAEFFILPGTKTLLMMGKTEGPDHGKIEKYIADKAIDSIILKGPGGSLSTALEIANVVIENKISTLVPENTDCASACSLIFSAGSNRIMEPGSRLGFHLPFLDVGLVGGGKFCKRLKGMDPDSLEYLLPSGINEECLRLTYEKGLRDVRQFSKILDRGGISEKVIDLIFDTSRDDITWVSVSDAEDYGLAN